MGDEEQPPRLTGFGKRISKCFCVPHHITIALMGFCGIVVAYATRVSLSVAINYIVLEVNKTERETGDACPSDESANTTSNPNIKQFEWTSTTKGWVLSSFYVGYLLSHVPGGLLAEAYGAKHIMGIGIMSGGALQLIAPIVTEKFDWQGLVVIRIGLGLGQGVMFPALSVLLARWIPPEKKSRLGTLAMTGVQIGTIVGNSLSGWLIDFSSRWDVVFYLFGCLTISWWILYQLICYSTPDTHPFISDKEYYYLKAVFPPSNKKTGFKDTPWKGIMSNLPVWTVMVASFGHDWGLFTMITDLPLYMHDLLRFKLTANGFLSSLPYLCMWIVSQLAAWAADSLIKNKKCSVTVLRKVYTTLAAVGPAIFLAMAPYSGCNKIPNIALFCIGMGVMGFFYPGLRLSALDLSPTYSGTLMALVNGTGTISGIIAPSLVGYITTQNTFKEWKLVFWICFIILVGTVLLFVFCGAGEPQDFDHEDYVFPGCKEACKRQRQNIPTNLGFNRKAKEEDNAA